MALKYGWLAPAQVKRKTQVKETQAIAKILEQEKGRAQKNDGIKNTKWDEKSKKGPERDDQLTGNEPVNLRWNVQIKQVKYTMSGWTINQIMELIW